MKISMLLLGIMLLFASPLPAQEEELSTLSLMPAATTGISHGYALWATEQLDSPKGCLYGPRPTAGAVAVYRARVAPGPEFCAQQEHAIGYIVFTYEAIPQERVCEVARAIREQHKRLILVGLVYGLEIKQAKSGRDYTSPRVVWCSTPVAGQPQT